MVMKRLLRLPGTLCPGEVLTGDAILDAYLKELDSRLLGSKYVRRLTLAEIKDHLQEKKAFLLAQGADEMSASEEAVINIGSTEEHSRLQRGNLRTKFIRCALASGIPFGLFMGLFSHITVTGENALGSLLIGLFDGVFFGLAMGLFLTFIWPERWLGGKKESIPPGEIEFKVVYPKWLRYLGLFWLIVLPLMAVTCLIGAIAALLHPGIQEQILFPWWAAFGLGALALVDTFLVGAGRRSFLVDADGFWIKGWAGKKRRISWNDVKVIGTIGEAHPWIPRWNYWRRVKFVDYASENGRKYRTLIYRDMVNADRFLQLLQEKTKETRQGTAATNTQ